MAALAYICDLLGFDIIATWLRSRDEPLRLEDATKHVARLEVHSQRCYQCGKALTDGDMVTWLEWPNGQRSGMLHVACDEKLNAAKPPDDCPRVPARQPGALRSDGDRLRSRASR